MTTKLLAVDDSKTMRRVLEITFSGEEFQTTIAGGSEQALAAVKADPPQVAVVDAHLGAESGYDLCRSIKAAAPGTRVLILSSKQRPYDESKGQSAGADGHFDKPFDSTKMIAKVTEQAANAGPQASRGPSPAGPPPSAAARPAPPQTAAAQPAAAQPAAVQPTPARPAAVRPAPIAQPASAPKSQPAGFSRGPEATGRRPVAPAATSTSGTGPQASIPSGSASVSRPGGSASARPAAAASAGRSAALPADLESKLQGLGLSADQVQAVLALSKEVVEQVVWEVVPALAETMIKEEIARLTAE